MSGQRTQAGGLTLQIGGRSRHELTQSLREAGVQLNAFAETLLERPEFENPTSQSLDVVVRTVGELGHPDGAVQSEIFAAAAAHGLELCPLLAGPDLRLALLHQADAPDSVLSGGKAPTGAIHVASAPLSDDVDYPKGFYLRVVDGQPWLRGYRCDDTYRWPAEATLAFALPTAPDKPGRSAAVGGRAPRCAQAGRGAR